MMVKTVTLYNADKIEMVTLEESLLNLSEKYLSKTLTPKDLSGVTFTITDLSAEDVLSFTPLIKQTERSNTWYNFHTVR